MALNCEGCQGPSGTVDPHDDDCTLVYITVHCYNLLLFCFPFVENIYILCLTFFKFIFVLHFKIGVAPLDQCPVSDTNMAQLVHSQNTIALCNIPGHQ
jgi:hypothetical protein